MGHVIIHSPCHSLTVSNCSRQMLSVLINVHSRDHFPTKLQMLRSHQLSSWELSGLYWHAAGQKMHAHIHIPFISCTKPYHFSRTQHSPCLFSYFEPTRIHTITIINVSPKQCWDSLWSWKIMKIAFFLVLKASEKGLNSSNMPKFMPGLGDKSIESFDISGC